LIRKDILCYFTKKESKMLGNAFTLFPTEPCISPTVHVHVQYIHELNICYLESNMLLIQETIFTGLILRWQQLFLIFKKLCIKQPQQKVYHVLLGAQVYYLFLKQKLLIIKDIIGFFYGHL
jgi:hypothetical protein